MVRGAFSLLFRTGSRSGGGGDVFGKLVSDILVCPLSRQTLRYCPDSQSLISDSIGVSFPIINGIPCLVPKDGKILEDQIKLTDDDDSSGGADRGI
ncbi:uncharacterized protein LOC141835208 [Curcuma longa]|uniref:uncharacterized protein LOC141835208 n=1 Tax=Curcuma longa TaxID=136217 RepID=UPI003D9E18EB